MSESHAIWHRAVLPSGWERALADLAARGALAGFYLAGGTGLALQFGHRRSVDLDLFAQTAFSSASLRTQLGELPGLVVRQAARGTLHLELHGILVSFLHYPYARLFPLRPFERIDVADPRDIACMKIDVLGSRGSRRDFVDLYVAAEQYGLAQILEWFERKYAGAPFNRLHILKALTYFVDAEAEPMPDMLVPLPWETIKRFFLVQAPLLANIG